MQAVWQDLSILYSSCRLPQAFCTVWVITRDEIFSFRVVCLLEMVSWVRLKMETGRSVAVRFKPFWWRIWMYYTWYLTVNYARKRGWRERVGVKGHAEQVRWRTPVTNSRKPRWPGACLLKSHVNTRTFRNFIFLARAYTTDISPLLPPRPHWLSVSCRACRVSRAVWPRIILFKSLKRFCNVCCVKTDAFCMCFYSTSLIYMSSLTLSLEHPDNAPSIFVVVWRPRWCGISSVHPGGQSSC